MRGALLAVAMTACADDAPHPSPGPPLVFDTRVRSTYTEVRACRFPGEHSGLNAFTVWASPDSVAPLDSLFQDPPGVDRLPEGTILVKELYAGTECDASQIEGWVAMKKEAGFDPAHADWHWQSVTKDERVVVDGADADCIGCHEGADSDSCVGYGELNGRDYVCTALQPGVP